MDGDSKSIEVDFGDDSYTNRVRRWLIGLAGCMRDDLKMTWKCPTNVISPTLIIISLHLSAQSYILRLNYCWCADMVSVGRTVGKQGVYKHVLAPRIVEQRLLTWVTSKAFFNGLYQSNIGGIWLWLILQAIYYSVMQGWRVWKHHSILKIPKIGAHIFKNISSFYFDPTKNSKILYKNVFSFFK